MNWFNKTFGKYFKGYTGIGSAMTTMFGLYRAYAPMITFEEAFTGALYNAMKIHADNMCRVKVIFKDLKGEVIDCTNPIYSSFYGVDNEYSFDQIQTLTNYHLNLYGAAYWKIVPFQRFFMIEPCQPSLVTQIDNGLDQIIGYSYKGQAMQLNKDFFVMRYVSPISNIANYPPYEAAKWVLSESLYMHRNKLGTLLNSGHAPYVMKNRMVKDKNVLKEAKEEHDKNHRGGTNSVLWITGDWEVNPMPTSAETLMYKEDLPQVEKDVYKIFGIPAHMVGDTQSYNKANITGSYSQFLESKIEPPALVEQNCINRILQSKRYGCTCEIKVEIPRDVELDQRMILEQYKSGLLTKRQTMKLLSIDIDESIPEELLDTTIMPNTFTRFDSDGNKMDSITTTTPIEEPKPIDENGEPVDDKPDDEEIPTDPEEEEPEKAFDYIQFIKAVKKAHSKFETSDEIKEDILNYYETNMIDVDKKQLYKELLNLDEYVQQNLSLSVIIMNIRRKDLNSYE